MSKKKWRIEIVLDFHNNKIKRKSTLDSIIERMPWNIPDTGLVEAQTPVNPEPIAGAVEPGHTHMHVQGSTSGRIRWELADIITGPPEAY